MRHLAEYTIETNRWRSVSWVPRLRSGCGTKKPAVPVCLRTARYADTSEKKMPALRSRHTQPQCITRLPHPETPHWNTRWKWVNGDRCPGSFDISYSKYMAPPHVMISAKPNPMLNKVFPSQHTDQEDENRCASRIRPQPRFLIIS